MNRHFLTKQEGVPGPVGEHLVFSATESIRYVNYLAVYGSPTILETEKFGNITRFPIHVKSCHRKLFSLLHCRCPRCRVDANYQKFIYYLQSSCYSAMAKLYTGFRS